MAYLTMDLVQQHLDKATALKIAGASFVGLSAAYIGKVWYSYQYFKNRNIPTPPYTFFKGNFAQLYENDTPSDVLKNWTDKYGKTYGYYQGHSPVYVTSDLDLIQQIFIKQSSNFAARKRIPLIFNDDDPSLSMIFTTKSRWKMTRNIMNPTFSNAKMREMCPSLIESVDRLIDILDENTDKEINIAPFMKRFTMDSIWNCAFGVDIDSQRNPNDPYFVRCETIMNNAACSKLDRIAAYIPMIRNAMLKTVIFLNRIFGVIMRENQFLSRIWIHKKLDSLIASCLNSESKKHDYIHLLLDAYMKADSNNTKLNSDADLTKDRVVKTLNLKEVKSNLVLFMLAGYDTTSIGLSYSLLTLAKYPEEQQKLVDEIDFDAECTTDNVHQYKYLDMFVKEVLRMNPIANPVIGRRCTKETIINDIKFEVDIPIVLDVMSVHFNQDYWGNIDVNEFRPERFVYFLLVHFFGEFELLFFLKLK
jgi:thromboxane-A synthase